MRYRILLMSLIASLLASGASAETSQRLLVLPFDNATGSPDFDGLAEGAADLLPVCLSNHASAPTVVERGALDELLRERGLEWEGLLDNSGNAGSLAFLGADVLVRGTLISSGGLLKVSVFLHDVGTTQLIASSTHEGALSEAFELFCNDATAEIARALSEDLAAPARLPADSAPRRTQLLLSGIGHYYNGNYAEAFPAFMKLVRRDETDAEARFWLARSFLRAGMTAYADHELRQFIVQFPADRNFRRAKALLQDIETIREN
jgi:TolB-like protein